MLPPAVHEGLQNISLKCSPDDLDIELITRFFVNRPFDEAYADGIRVQGLGSEDHYWRVMSLDDLVTSKVKAGRPKDLLDIQELRRLHNRG